ncbi:MAG: GIY-YIG nuclease family protein, partial [Saprospiraceae bacterium]|nr:GIY-YIG nuclease family protein [Saprospiraceae bacterium]
MTGLSIKVFLTDSNPNGLRYAEIGLSTVRGFVIPRNSLDKFGNREEKNKTGLYVLVGEDPDIPGRQKIYIGETDNIFKRLSEHNKSEQMDFWESTLVFITKDENLNKAHVKYLESVFIDIAKNSRRATLHNGSNPEPIKLSELEGADMTNMRDQILVLLPILGVSAFEVAHKTKNN